MELDFSFGIRGTCALPRQRLQPARRGGRASIRLIPYQIRDASRSSASPRSITKLAERPRGLVLVTGPTGRGKSTTLAAMIDKINQERRGHILTVEDPIEFVHAHKGCLVNQREIGTATRRPSRRALRAALREDPDVVLVGEMRDLGDDRGGAARSPRPAT